MPRKKIKILIVGAGKGGSLLIDMFYKSGLAKIIGVVDKNDDAPGIELAKKLGIQTSNDFKKLIKKKDLDEIINVTGSEKVQKELHRLKPQHVEVIGGYSAKFLWSLIEERKKIERAMRESENKFRKLSQTNSAAIYIVQGNHFLYVNPATEKITGYTFKELLSMNFWDVVHQDFRELVKERGIARQRGEKVPSRYEFKIISKDGKVCWLDTSAELIDYKGKPAIIATSIEITKRKKAEEALEKSEKKYRELYENLRDGLIAVDMSGRITEFNKAFQEMLGYTKREMYKLTHKDITPKKWLQIETKILEDQIMARGYSDLYKKEYIRKDGITFPVELRTHLIRDIEGCPVGTWAFIRDLTKHREVEEAIRESEEKFRAISSTAVDAILVMDNEGKISYWNPAAEKMFGYASNEAIGSELHLLLAPCRYHDAYKKGFSMFKKSGKGPAIGNISEFLAIRKDGTEFPIEVSTSAIQIKNNWQSVGIVRDITDRKRAEHALQESEQKYRTLFEESKDVVYISSPEGMFIDINPAGIELFGYSSKEELLQIDITRDLYVNPLDRKEFQRILGKQGFIKDYEIMFKRKDGQHLNVLITANAVTDKQDNIIAYRGIIKDITDRKRLEQQLLQAQKMEAVGQLAGGIAHDFNNILTAIIGFSTLLKMETKKDDILYSYVTQILTSAERAANLTQALLAFSRKQIISPKPINLNEIIKGIRALLTRIIGEDIELSTFLTDKDLIVMADSGQIEQVLMNLATNARDAMPDGGRLIISTDLVNFDYEFIKAHSYKKQGMYGLISVVDTGKGMDETIKGRIFEPFFTTKEVGKGTGLGLSMAYGIVQQHDGYINVYTEPGSGTTFKIYLPLIKSTIDVEQKEPVTFIKKGTETVLVAEDDIQVRDLIREVLEGFGYKVLEAVDGEDALKVFSRQKDKIQLVIFDVIMPKKNGKEIYNEIKKIRPDIKGIFTSGYDANIIHKKGILEEKLTFISKPISPEELLKKVRELLDT